VQKSVRLYCWEVLKSIWSWFTKIRLWDLDLKLFFSLFLPVLGSCWSHFPKRLFLASVVRLLRQIRIFSWAHHFSPHSWRKATLGWPWTNKSRGTRRKMVARASPWSSCSSCSKWQSLADASRRSCPWTRSLRYTHTHHTYDLFCTETHWWTIIERYLLYKDISYIIYYTLL